MKRTYEKSSQPITSVKPTTLNLQTRGFAPPQADEDIPRQTRSTSSENILEKLISNSKYEPANTYIQRKPQNRLKAICAQRKSTIQAKLSIGNPNDKYEKEADNTAAKVVQQINSSTKNDSIQRDESIESEDEELQMKSLLQRQGNVGGSEVSADLESSIQSARSSGNSLDANLQVKMGKVMGADFSRVKVHHDSQADKLNKSIQAKAFTTGQDVFFRQGAYDPSSRGGQELIAHELTHVVQQNSGSIQRSATNSSSSQLIQRYTVIDPADYVFGNGSQFVSQDVVFGGNKAKFVNTTREQTPTGLEDTKKEGVGLGAWNTTSNKVASASPLPRLKYGTDGTSAIGIEDTTAEPKVFYATTDVITASNTKLQSVQAEARLVDAGGSLDAPQDVTLPNGATLNLHMVKPGKIETGMAPQVLEKFGQISECNSFIKYIIGDINDRVAVFGPGQGSEAIVKEEKEPTQEIANFASTQVGNGQALANHLTTSGVTSSDHNIALPNTYKNMGGKNARDNVLGINSGAKAGVGEGYVITQGSPMPDSVTIRSWLTGLDKKIAGSALNSAEIDMFKHKWGYHYAGIVAAVGDDAVSLENYNRGTQLSWAIDDLYNEKIQAVVELRNYLETLANKNKTIPSIPKLRNQWFRDLEAEINELGKKASAEQLAARDALNEVAKATKGMEIGASELWHFKMYGTGAGQSFHEQWEGSLDDPTTMRIRQSEASDLTKTRYVNQVESAIGMLYGEKVSPAAAYKLAEIAANDLPALRNATTRDIITTKVNSVETKVFELAVTAMHDWAVDAAALMGKKATIVPDAPNKPTQNSLKPYSDELTNLIQPWESKGWAIKKKSKQSLSDRRAQLAEFKRKIVAASLIVVG